MHNKISSYIDFSTFPKKIELKFGNEVISGVAQNIDENGELQILMEKTNNRKPEVRSFSVGEVFEKIVYSS